MKLGVPKETFPGEYRVAVVPAVLPTLKKLGLDVVVEHDAGAAAGFPDAGYADQQAVIGTRADVFSADILAQVRAPGANPSAGAADVAAFHQNQLVIGFAEPLTALDSAAAVARTGAMLVAMELVPRLTRAQSMGAPCSWG